MAKKAKVAVEATPPTQAEMIAFCLVCFADFLSAGATLADAKEAWDAARQGLRIELARAYKVIGKGRAWDAFCKALREALVGEKVCASVKDAGRLIRNQLIALSITGNGKNGVRKGRKEKEATGEKSDKTSKAAAFNAAALRYISKAQQKHAADDEVIEMLGELAAILTGSADK